MEIDKDDKSIVEKTVEAVKGLAASISEAAHKTAEPEPIRSGDEVVMMPMATAGMISETVVPPFVVVRRPKKSPKKTRAKSARNAGKAKSAKKAPKKAKKSTKRSKSSTVRKAVGKKSRKQVKKKAAKKSRR
jgi:hypothetical protein